MVDLTYIQWRSCPLGSEDGFRRHVNGTPRHPSLCGPEMIAANRFSGWPWKEWRVHVARWCDAELGESKPPKEQGEDSISYPSIFQFDRS